VGQEAKETSTGPAAAHTSQDHHGSVCRGLNLNTSISKTKASHNRDQEKLTETKEDMPRAWSEKGTFTKDLHFPRTFLLESTRGEEQTQQE
jgi:hypothetical protein